MMPNLGHSPKNRPSTYNIIILSLSMYFNTWLCFLISGEGLLSAAGLLHDCFYVKKGRDLLWAAERWDIFFWQILDKLIQIWTIALLSFKHIFFTQLCTQNCQIHKVRLLFIYNLTPCNSHAKSYSYFLLKSHLVNYVVLIEVTAIK